jgi:hypothetical protein
MIKNMRKCKPKSICSGRKKIKKEWIGHKVLDLKTGESEWKMKRNQEIKDYHEPLKGEHLHTPRRQWKKGFERLAHNFAKGKKERRRGERKERNKTKNE